MDKSENRHQEESGYDGHAGSFPEFLFELWNSAMQQQESREGVEPFKALYEQEVSKLFHMPQLGLARFYQERMNRCTDEFNKLALELVKFINMLSAPLSRSFAELNSSLSKDSENQEQTFSQQEMDEIYRRWISILENRYLELLQTEEFTSVLHTVLSRYSLFQENQQQIVKDILKFSPISSKDDFDEMAKENHALKKRVKSLEKRIGELEDRLSSMESWQS